MILPRPGAGPSRIVPGAATPNGLAARCGIPVANQEWVSVTKVGNQMGRSGGALEIPMLWELGEWAYTLILSSPSTHRATISG